MLQSNQKCRKLGIPYFREGQRGKKVWNMRWRLKSTGPEPLARQVNGFPIMASSDWPNLQCMHSGILGTVRRRVSWVIAAVQTCASFLIPGNSQLFVSCKSSYVMSLIPKIARC
jgi:hypothetical protein